MTAMRDARLQQALSHAPDDGLRPSPGVRESVQLFAHQAVRTAPAPVVLPLWRRAWRGAGRISGPWHAAFATLLLAALVTVVWWDAPVPGASPELREQQTTGKAEEKKVDIAPPAETEPSAPPAPAALPAPAAPPAPAPTPAPTPRRSEPATSASATGAAGAARERVEPAQADAVTEQSRARPTPQAPLAMAQKADPLQIVLNGRSLATTPQQAREIQILAQALAAQADGSEALQAPVIGVIEWRGELGSAGVLQLAPPQVRWVPGGPGASPSTGRPQPAQLQALLDVLAELPTR